MFNGGFSPSFLFAALPDWRSALQTGEPLFPAVSVFTLQLEKICAPVRKPILRKCENAEMQ